MQLKDKIRTIPHWPKKGIMYHDITTLLKDEKSFTHACNLFKQQYEDKKFDAIVAIESRGFIFGAVLASLLHKPFILVRKKGKLPAETITEDYDLEYGSDSIEMHKDALKKADKVLIIDDILATGGTCKAACKLVEKAGAIVMGCAFVIEIKHLAGREKLADYEIYSLVTYSK